MAGVVAKLTRIKVNIIDDFLTPENVAELLNLCNRHCLWTASMMLNKRALILHCRFNKIPLIVSGGAGVSSIRLKLRGGSIKKQNKTNVSEATCQLRARGICKKPREILALPVFTQSTIHISKRRCLRSIGWLALWWRMVQRWW